MYRKLVPFNGRQFCEVDQVALKRTAEHLYQVIKDLDIDEYEIKNRLLPALKKAINMEISAPYRDKRELISGRYLHDRMEGLLPDYLDSEFQSLFSKFVVAALAYPLEVPEIEFIKGEQHAWAEFEEEGDWPDKVKYP